MPRCKKSSVGKSDAPKERSINMNDKTGLLTEAEFKLLSPEDQVAYLKRLEDFTVACKASAASDELLPKMNMKDFSEKVKSIIEGQLKTMTNADKKHFMFPGIGEDKTLADDKSPEAKWLKTKKFFTALVGGDRQTLGAMHNDVKVKAGLSEGISTSGGFLVPEEFRAEILRLVPNFGVMRANARMIPMASDIAHIPVSNSFNSATWTSEKGSIAQTDVAFGQVTLVINKLAAIPQVSNELLQDANVPVIQWLAQVVAESFAKEEDNQGFNGTGSPFVGVLAATGVPTSPHIGGTAMICLSYQDLVSATGNIYANALQNAKFYFHRSMIARIRGLITTAGAPIFGATTNDVAGYPMVNTEALPSTASSSSQTSGFAYSVFGDLSRGMAMGERGAMTMRLSEEATVAGNNLFQQDMVALRVIERVCFAVLLPSAFTRIQC